MTLPAKSSVFADTIRIFLDVATMAGKAHKIHTLVEACRARADCQHEGVEGSGKNAAAVDKLSLFLSAFQAIHGGGSEDQGQEDGSGSDTGSKGRITTKQQWDAFVDAHVCNPGAWESKLHFDTILTDCFGFEAKTAAEIRATLHEAKTLEQYSVRWLSSALSAFGPEGCLGDVVNLAVSMSHSEEPSDVSQQSVVRILNNLGDTLKDADAAQLLRSRNLWIPTHLVHDAETDDSLTWLMLEHVRRLLALPPLQTVVQLPENRAFDDAEAHFVSKGGTVFRDDCSWNGEAVAKNLAHLF